jgi:hypothetical protein
MKLKTKFERESFWDLVVAAERELGRACGKFPLFPDRFADMSLARVRAGLEAARARNDSAGGCEATALSVISEEYCEFAEAVLSGDFEAARVELVQTIAMLLRAGIHLEHYCRCERQGIQGGGAVADQLMSNDNISGGR